MDEAAADAEGEGMSRGEAPLTEPLYALREACQRMVDDYQTSDNHHPNHVLVRADVFYGIRDMLCRPDEPKQGATCRFCKGREWVEDQNWSPRYSDVDQDRVEGDGLIRCGVC